MKATVVDLRYKMHDVLKALARKEEVTILYRGQIRGRIVPPSDRSTRKVKTHPFFGMASKSRTSVLQELDDLRSARIRDL